jgi:hypothetical protein
MYNIKHKYLLEYLFIIVQLTPLATIGTLVSSVYAFLYFSLVNKVDIYKLFLLLLPSIVLRGSSEFFFGFNTSQFDETGWFAIYIPTLVPTVIVGPLAISVKLFLGLAVPFRLLSSLYKGKIKNYSTIVLYIILLVLAIIGLIMARSLGIQSDGGITIGLRIALVVGVLYLPLFTDYDVVFEQVMKIVKVSVVLLLLGLSNSHWFFVTVSFFPFLLFTEKKIYWKAVSILMVVVFFVGGFTFTVKLTILFSLLFNLIIYTPSLYRRYSVLFTNNVFRFLVVFFPIYFCLLVIFGSIESLASQIGERFYLKLIDDRGLIWISTFQLIASSDLLVVPAGRDIPVFEMALSRFRDWGAGAHNIYLEIIRQLGFTYFIGYLILVVPFLMRLTSSMGARPKIFAYFSSSLLAVYLVFGLTGNSLVYDGVGFLYWLIVGQLARVGYSEKQSTNQSF